jgi:CBS domain-containing protein
MLARDVMTANVVAVAPETDVREIAKLLLENRISAVPVIDGEGRLVGIVSEGDLMRRPETGTMHPTPWWLWLLVLPEDQARKYVKTHGHHAREVMTSRLITIGENAPLEEIADVLERRRIKRVPVVRDGKLVGIVSRADLLRGLAARQAGTAFSIEDQAIKETIERELAEAGVMARRVKIIVSGGIVHIWGTVITPDEKDAVRVAVEGIPGVKEVRDNVVALPPDERAYYWTM